MLPVVHWKLFILSPWKRASGKKKNKNKNYVVCTGTVEADGRIYVARGVIHYRQFNVFTALAQISCQVVHLLS
jgi:hypothetical protein